MKKNSLLININKPINEVFSFTITPPNSTQWIPSVIREETTEWPINVGTTYVLYFKNSDISEVTVVDIKENEYIEWESQDKNYHCRYTYKPYGDNGTQLEYVEWVDKGEITEPFNQGVLQKLKYAIEKEDVRTIV